MAVGGDENEVERLGKLNQLYLAIISRYKDYIQEKEGLSVAELPTLVTPKDEAVVKKAAEIKGGFEGYTYERDFYPAATAAFSFVKTGIEDAVLPLEFWLSPRDTLTYTMGDMIDKNILLCSMLIALGNPSAKVFVKMKDENFGAFVYCTFNNKIYKFDMGNGAKEFENKETLIASLGIDDDTTAYEFNNQAYLDIS
jgi:hypothetical protein